MQLRSAAGSSTPSAAARRAAGRQRQRDLASDLPLILGGIALATVALLGFGTLIGLRPRLRDRPDLAPAGLGGPGRSGPPPAGPGSPLPPRPPALAAPDGAGPPWLRPGPGATGAASPLRPPRSPSPSFPPPALRLPPRLRLSGPLSLPVILRAAAVPLAYLLLALAGAAAGLALAAAVLALAGRTLFDVTPLTAQLILVCAPLLGLLPLSLLLLGALPRSALPRPYAPTSGA